MTAQPFEPPATSHRTPQEELVALRRACGLTLIEAAGRLGISKSELGRIERGERQASRARLAAMATLYGIALDRLEKRLAAAPPAEAAAMPSARPAPDGNHVALPPGLFPPGTVTVVDRAARVLLGDHFLPPGPAPAPLRLAMSEGRLVGLGYDGAIVLTEPRPETLVKIVAILLP